MIRKNPAKGSRKGIDKEVSKKRALTIEEQETMLEFTRKSNSYKIHYPLIVFALSTGLPFAGFFLIISESTAACRHSDNIM